MTPMSRGIASATASTMSAGRSAIAIEAERLNRGHRARPAPTSISAARNRATEYTYAWPASGAARPGGRLP